MEHGYQAVLEESKPYAIYNNVTKYRLGATREFMIDVREITSRLSELAQRDVLDPSSWSLKLASVMSELEGMKTNLGAAESAYNSEIDRARELYKGIGCVDIDDDEEEHKALRVRYLSTLLAQMDERLPLRDVVNQARMTLFDFSRYPGATATPTEKAEYGNEALAALITRFWYLFEREPQWHGTSKAEVIALAKKELTEVKARVASWSTRTNKEIRQMLFTSFGCQFPLFTHTILIDAACIMDSNDCERFISKQNLIKTKQRTRIGDGLLDNCLQICINGPPPEEVDYPAVLQIWHAASVRGRYNGVWKADNSS